MNKVKLLIRMLGLTQVQVRPKHQVRSSINVLFIEGLVYQIATWQLVTCSPKKSFVSSVLGKILGVDHDLFILDDLYQMTNIKGSF